MIGLVFLYLVASSMAVKAPPEYCLNEQDQYTVPKVPAHDCDCNAKAAGALRYHNNKIQFCNGVKYEDVGGGVSRFGSEENPAKSCNEILTKDSESKSGVYYLKLGDAVVKAYCYMEEMCGSKGWTMIMKINGAKDTFRFQSSYWTNKNVYNIAGAAGGLDGQETKLDTYSRFPFNKLCLGLKTGGVTNWMFLGYKASSLYSLIADNKYRATTEGRNAWKNLIRDSSLQRNCNREGFNTNSGNGAMARIGIIGNQENDCNSADSRIGFGTGGNRCGQHDKNSAGNEARCSPDNRDKSIKSFGYIFAQQPVNAAPLGSYDNPAASCHAISEPKSGVYYLKLGDAVVKAYCYMGEMCGSKGWTMIMKINGASDTFRFQSSYWTNKNVYNTAGAAGGLDGQETKLDTYSRFPFNKLCLGMKTGGVTNWMFLGYKASSLYSLIADNKYRATTEGRNAWKSLIRDSSLQRNCNREGFNTNSGNGAMARIGIIGNQENDCNSADSRIGFGTGGNRCGQHDKNSAGNEARCSPDNRDKSIKSFGYIFAQQPVNGAPLGSYDNPAASCHAISEPKSGVYYLKLGDAVVKAYCYMGEICGSKGWTMIMKINGASDTFRFQSLYWTNKNVYNTAGAAGGLDGQETKLDTYSRFPFNKLCLGMKTGGVTNWMSLSYKASSLYSLIADNKYRATRQGRNAWKSLIRDSSLQRNCNREGFNTNSGNGAMARIGIIGNQENDCNSADSRIGFGTGGNRCGQHDKNSAGNEARCSPDNRDKSIKSFGYIFAQ